MIERRKADSGGRRLNKGRRIEDGTDMKRSYILPHYAVTPAPAAPTVLTATAVSSSQINLSWTASAGPALKDYGVYRQGAGLLGFVTATSFNDTGLVVGTSYTYFVTARNLALVESAPSNFASATTTSSGTITHGQSVTIPGSGFGTKSRGIGWYLDDHGQALVGALDGQWTGGYTRNNAANGGLYNIQNRLGSTFNPNGNAAPAGTPHSFISVIQAWANAGVAADTGWLGGPYKDYTIPALPYAGFTSCYFRCDPAWIFGNKNYKGVGMNSAGGVLGGTTGDIDWFWTFNAANSPGSNTDVSKQIQFTDNLTALQNPDAAGHSLFWNELLSPFNPANGYNGGWLKLEMEFCMSSVLGLGAGYIDVCCNGLQVAHYQGRTCNSVKAVHTFMSGAHLYTGDNGHVENFNYGADHRIDCTSTLAAATGHVARVYLSNASNPFAGTLGSGIYVTREPQTPTAWGDSNITVTVNKGVLSSGPCYFGIVSEDGTQQVKGPFVLT